MQPLNKRPPSLIVTMPGLYQNPSRKTSTHLLRNDITPLFNKIWDEVENTVVKEIETVTQIISDLFLKLKCH
jgi:hypothetical protein